MLNKIALALVIIGAVNWGLVGLFQFDLVGWIFGGMDQQHLIWQMLPVEDMAGL